MKAAGFWTMIGGGAIALGAPLYGLLGTVFGMMQGFTVLGNSGVANPRDLAESIGTALMSTATGLFIGGFGLAIFAVGLIFWLTAKSQASPPPMP